MKFLSKLFGGLFGDTGIVTRMFSAIGDFFENIFHSLFKSGAKEAVKDVVKSSEPDNKTPDASPSQPTVAKDTTPDKPAEEKKEEPLVDDATGEKIAGIVKVAHSPLVSQAKDGRLVIQVPEGAHVSLFPDDKNSSRVNVAIYESSINHTEQTPILRPLSIPRDLAENAQTAFQIINPTEATANKHTSFGATYGMLPKDMALVIQGKEASHHVEVKGVAAYVNGQFHNRYQPQYSSPVINEDYLHNMVINENDRDKRAYLASLYESPKDDGRPHTRAAIEAEEQLRARQEEQHLKEIMEPGYLDKRMAAAGITKGERKPDAGLEKWNKIIADNHIDVTAPVPEEKRQPRFQDMAFSPYEMSGQNVDGSSVGHYVAKSAPSTPRGTELAQATRERGAQYSQNHSTYGSQVSDDLSLGSLQPLGRHGVPLSHLGTGGAGLGGVGRFGRHGVRLSHLSTGWGND